MEDIFIFIITLIGITFTFIGGMITYFLKSKCTDVSCCWGCIDVKRDVDDELKEELAQIDHGIDPFKFDASKTEIH